MSPWAGNLWRRWIRSLTNEYRSSRKAAPPRKRRTLLQVEVLEDRTAPASFTVGDIAVLDLAAASTNTTGSVQEINPSSGALVQSISIASTGPSAMRFSDSGTSGFLSDTNDRTLLAFAGYNTTDTTDADLANSPTSDRAVGTLDNGANFTLQTTYTGTTGNQARSATSLNDSNFFITDKGGLYTNGATAPSLTTNILVTRSFGGQVYVASTKATSAVSTASSPTASSISGLPGIGADSKIQDFYLIQSGSNGSTYDVLYTIDQGSSSATINKFSLVSGSWVANGSYTFASNGEAMIAAANGSGGAYLYVTTDPSAGLAGNSLVRLTDTAGYNATISINTANNVTLYTATGGSALKGLEFVPQPATVPTVANPTDSAVGISTATLGGTAVVTGGEAITQEGVVYSSTNTNPTIGGSGVTPVPGSGTSLGAFIVGVSGLQGTTTYYYAAYATSSAGTGYSSVGTFTTSSANPPAIDTPTDTDIATSSATLGGTVESNGGATITQTGVVYALTSENSNPQIGGTDVNEVDTGSPVNSGAFTVSATGLTAGASYTFEVFATNSSGTTYAAPTNFTTLAAPTVNAPTYAAVTSNSATLGATIASNGGSSITAWGVAYSLTSVDSNPHLNDPDATVVYATGTPGGTFTLPVTGLSGSSSYTFKAFATNSVGTTYNPATSFTTAAPGVIAAWTFPATAGAGDNSPAPTYGIGTATTLGMTNSYNGGNTASDDVVSTSGTANPNFTENLWRVRGTAHNGWALAAPEYSQGIELDTSTVGFSNIVFSFDWYSTTQGIRDLQVQYNTDVNNPDGWVNYQGPSPTGTFVATSNDYNNAGLSPVSPTIYINLSGVAGANNDPNLGIRLVSAYDSTGTLGDEYASAASTAGDIVPYNNSSGNWRFGDLTFSAGITTTTTVAANPPGGQSPGQDVTFTATVTPASGAQFPSGTVNFYDGSTLIGTQSVTQSGATNVGTAILMLNDLAPGVHGDITAQYTPASGNGLIASGSSMNLVAGAPTDNPISYTINAPQATGVDVSPVANQSFTGVVATFSDGTYTDPTGFSASIVWGDGHTSSGTIAFTGTTNETNINGQIVPVNLFTVTGTNTYAATGTYPLSVTITDPNGNSATVAATARVAYAPLAVTAAGTVNTALGNSLVNQTVATFTDPGLVANLTALGIGDPTTQFSATINWGDGTPTDPDTTAGTITYDPATQTFRVVGSHTYAQSGSYSISVAVTSLTLSVERIDSSDPTNLNLVGDENGNGLTDSPSADFIDQYVIGAANQIGPLYTTSLPTVAASGGNEALTNSSYSVSEGELTLSTNGLYLVTGGYNDTVSVWAPQQTFSPASTINRVIGTVDGNSDINTTTDLTDAYSGDNFRGVASSNGIQFWTVGHSGTVGDDYVHYAQLGATTSTTITGADSTPYNPENINTVEIINGQLYEGVRSAGGATAPAGIYQVGTGLPTAGGQAETLFIALPQSNPLDITSSDKPMSPFGFWMTDLPGNSYSVNGVNVAYVADAEMGIARYDYGITGSETTPQWNFSYYIDSTGSFKDSVYTVNSDGSVTATSEFNSTNPIPSNNPNADPTKAGGVRELTGRVVDGQVQLFAVTGFGTGSQPNPGGSLIEVTDTGANAGFTTLATNPTADPSELTGVAFSPTAVVTDAAQVLAVANPGTQNSAVGDKVALQIEASGLPAGATWTYSAPSLPSGLSINSSTGLITGTITRTATSYSVSVTASDGQGGSAGANFSWNVSTLSVTNPGTQNSPAGSSVSLAISAAGLPAGDSWTYSATGLPGGLSIDPATGVISGTITGAAGAHAVTVSAADGQGAIVGQSFTWNVALSVANPGTQNSAVGDAVALALQANGLQSGATWSYSATGLPGGLLISPSTGVISGTITGVAKTYLVTVTARDSLGGSAGQSFLWNVAKLAVANPGTQISAVGDTVALQIEASGLPAGGAWAYAATGLPAGLTVTNSGLIQGTISGAAQRYAAMITASDGNGASVSQRFSWNVSALSVTNPGTKNNAVGDTVSLQVKTGGLPVGDTWTYSATGLPGGLSIDNAVAISGTVAGTGQSYSVTVTAGDGHGGSASQTFTWNVSTLAVTNPGTQNSAVGDKVSLTLQTSGLPTGDQWAFAATGLPAGLSINARTGIISGKVTGTAQSYFVTVTAVDGHGAVASQDFTWNVSVLTVTNPGPQSAADGSPVSLAIQVNGFPAGATITYSASGLPIGLSINPTTGLIGGTVTGPSKVYSVRVTVIDGEGASASQPFTFDVT